MRRGILGGTFDPPHLAHLLAGEAVFRALSLDVVTFMPAGVPWQKQDRPISSPEHRWRMTSLSIQGVDYFSADRRELERSGPSYTIDTLEELPAGEEPVLILGADSAAGLPTWRRWRDVLERARLAVVPRPGTSREDVESAVGRSVEWVPMPEVPISGTMLRSRVRSGDSIRFLVAEPVWLYITDNSLYVEGT